MANQVASAHIPPSGAAGQVPDYEALLAHLDRLQSQVNFVTPLHQQLVYSWPQSTRSIHCGRLFRIWLLLSWHRQQAMRKCLRRSAR